MFTTRALRSYFFLFIQSLLIILAVIGLSKVRPAIFAWTDAVVLTVCFTVAALISLLIFFNGNSSDARKSVLMTLVAVSVKFLLSLIIALLFFVIFKNRETGSVILFFILYLAFTVFIILTFLNILKKKSV
jgi:hypothetical protein